MNNRVQSLREMLLLSKAELARRAGLSTLTIDRVEKGRSCRMETKRKIIIALGFTLADKDVVFGDRDPDPRLLAEAASRLSTWEEEQAREKEARSSRKLKPVHRRPIRKSALDSENPEQSL